MPKKSVQPYLGYKVIETALAVPKTASEKAKIKKPKVTMKSPKPTPSAPKTKPMTVQTSGPKTPGVSGKRTTKPFGKVNTISGPKGKSGFTTHRPEGVQAQRYQGKAIKAHAKAQRPLRATVKAKRAKGAAAYAGKGAKSIASKAGWVARPMTEHIASRGAHKAGLAGAGFAKRQGLRGLRAISGIGNVARVAGRVSLVTSAALAAKDISGMAYQGYKSYKAQSHVDKTAEAAKKHGVRVTRKPFVIGLLTGDPGVKVHKKKK